MLNYNLELYIDRFLEPADPVQFKQSLKRLKLDVDPDGPNEYEITSMRSLIDVLRLLGELSEDDSAVLILSASG